MSSTDFLTQRILFDMLVKAHGGQERIINGADAANDWLMFDDERRPV